MPASAQISDRDLHAYVDGELDQARTLEVEDYLRRNPEKAEDVSAWKKQNETLQGLYANMGNEPLPDRLNPHQIATSRTHPTHPVGFWSGWRSVAAMLTLFVCGATAGWIGHDFVSKPTSFAQQKPMVRQALAAHTTYAVEILHPVDVSGSDKQHLVSWLSKRLEIPVKAPDLGKEGFTLVGGSLLPGEQGVAAQFMYEDHRGQRITLYLLRNRNADASSFRFASHKTMNAFYWHDKKISYVLVGNVTRGALSPLAHTIYAQLTGLSPG